MGLAADEGLVPRVIDAQTIEVQIGPTLELVRYIGISILSLCHPTRGASVLEAGAREANRQLVEGRRVSLMFDVQRRDREGRLLAYVYLNEILINAELVRQGYAEVATLPPNLGHRQELLARQREARDARRGFWSDPDVLRVYEPCGAGVYGNPRIKTFFHPDDPLRDVAVTDSYVYFQNAEAARSAGYEPSLDYAVYSARERQNLTGLPSAAASAPLGGGTTGGGFATGGTGGGDVFVRGYTRSNGTYVAPYTRSSPRR